MPAAHESVQLAPVQPTGSAPAPISLEQPTDPGAKLQPQASAPPADTNATPPSAGFAPASASSAAAAEPMPAAHESVQPAPLRPTGSAPAPISLEQPTDPVPKLPTPSPNPTPQPRPKPISLHRCPPVRPWAEPRREPRNPTCRNPPQPWPRLLPRLSRNRCPVQHRSIQMRHHHHLRALPRLQPRRRLLPSPCRPFTNPCNWRPYNRPSPLSRHQCLTQWQRTLLTVDVNAIAASAPRAPESVSEQPAAIPAWPGTAHGSGCQACATS